MTDSFKLQLHRSGRISGRKNFIVLLSCLFPSVPTPNWPHEMLDLFELILLCCVNTTQSERSDRHDHFAVMNLYLKTGGGL